MISNHGRGYYNEGGGADVPRFHRNLAEDRRQERERVKIIDGGNEGVVCGVIFKGEWMNRCRYWKGHARPGVMVSWDDQVLPIDVAEEADLEKLEGSFSPRRLQEKKVRKDLFAKLKQ